MIGYGKATETRRIMKIDSTLGIRPVSTRSMWLTKRSSPIKAKCKGMIRREGLWMRQPAII